MQGSQMENEVKEFAVRPVNTIQFNREDDVELMQLINSYASIFNERIMKKTPPRNAIRNFLIEELPKAINRIIGNNGAGGSDAHLRR